MIVWVKWGCEGVGAALIYIITTCMSAWVVVGVIVSVHVIAWLKVGCVGVAALTDSMTVCLCVGGCGCVCVGVCG